MKNTPPYYAPLKSTWTLKWGGITTVAPSAFDALQMIGERSHSPSDHKYPKRGIAHRVFVQYQILISEELSDEAFLMSLAEFGVIELSVRGEAPPDILQGAVEFSEAWHRNN